MVPNRSDGFLQGKRGRDGYLRFERDPAGRIRAAFVGARPVRRRALREMAGARKGRMVW
jgi:hypothetical protein